MKLGDLKQYEGRPRTIAAAPPPVRTAVGHPGAEYQSPHGPYVAAEFARPAGNAHGLHALAPVGALSSDHYSRLLLDPDVRYADLSHVVFLDTETTGLGMGVGTYVFLVGAGYLDGDSFRVRQFFLRSPGEEVPFLQALSEFLSGFSALVTFNGKAFDWPLMETRYTLRRKAIPLPDAPHLDLLHPARRLWKRRVESCTLSSLERNVLHAGRAENDVPGWLIPSLYFQYLRDGDAGPLSSVFCHNVHDILSLAALSVHMQRVIDDPFCGLSDHPLDLFSLGVNFDRYGDRGMAAQCFEEALRRVLPVAERGECLTRLSALYKREGQWGEAERVWDEMIDLGGQAALFGLIEYAKYYEHVSRDFESAIETVAQALGHLDLHPGLAPLAERKELEHRAARLAARSFRGRHGK